MNTWRRCLKSTLAVVALLTCTAAADVRVVMAPSDTLVQRGATIDVRFVVPVAGATFNGYEAIIAFDPSMVAPEPMTPLDDQQGSLMLSVCNFCYHRYWPPAPGVDSLKITHVTMCGVPHPLTGPGILYRLRFRALQKGETVIRFFRLRFTDGGPHVTPVLTEDARVRISGASTRGRGVVARAHDTWTTIKEFFR